ncbi:transposase [Staphylococcus aureus]|nr:transposase [Staphylococcus aureus]
MCNDTLELLRIKDENIKYINQEIDVIIKGKKATVVNAVLTYKAFNNGAIEGINNKIKLIKRISFGYRNFNNFKARIMMIFSLYKGEKKKTTKPNNGLAA